MNLFLLLILLAFGGNSANASCSAEDSLEWATWGDSQAFLLRFQRLTSDTTVLQGSFTAFFEGRRIIEGQFDANLKSGHWQHYDPILGNLTAEGSYDHGKRVKQWTFYYSDGSLRAQKKYTAGKLFGEMRSFHPNASLAAEVIFENDSIVRRFISYYDSGDTALVRDFQQDQKQLKIQHRSFYLKGPPFEIYEAQVDLASPSLMNQLAQGKDPLMLIYAADQEDLLDDEPPFHYLGSYRKYHITGRLWEHLWFDKGKLFEYYACNDQWGNTLEKGDFSNGSGKAIRYHQAADTALIVHYNGGRRDGLFTYFREGFLPGFSGEFTQGSASGIWFLYDRNGRIRKEFRFNNDSTSVREERRNDVRDHVGYYVNRRKEGTWIHFDFYGDTASVTNFRNGMKEGQYLEYRRGALFKEGSFDQDVRTGEWTTFNMRGKETWNDRLPEVQGTNGSHDVWQLYFDEKIEAANRHELTYHKARLPYKFREEQVRKINERYYRVKMMVGETDGDANFKLLIEDTGHVIAIECITFNRPEFYEFALGLLQNLAFMYPGSFEQIPRTNKETVAFYFEEL